MLQLYSVPDVDFLVCTEDRSLFPDAPLFTQAKQRAMRNTDPPQPSQRQDGKRVKRCIEDVGVVPQTHFLASN